MKLQIQVFYFSMWISTIPQIVKEKLDPTLTS